MLLNFIHLTSTFIAQQTVGEPLTNSLLQYGIAGALIILLIMLFRFFANHSSKENIAREDKIMEHNKSREEAYKDTVLTLKSLIRDLDTNWKTTADRMDRNYQDSIDKFIKVIDKVMDQNSYTTQILVELKDKIEHYTKRNDIEEMKKEIINHINKINLQYNLTPKNRD